MSKLNRRGGFTLIEVLIVVVIMAVLAATIIPQFSSSTKDAKESTLKFNVQTIQSQLEMYKVHHSGKVPAVTDNSLPQLTKATDAAGTASTSGAADATHPFGPYINEIPANPFNNLSTVKKGTDNTVPTTGDNSSGWIFDEAAAKIYPNNPEYYQGTKQY